MNRIERANTLCGIAQILNVVKSEWGASWSEWDQQMLSALNNMQQELLEPAMMSGGTLEERARRFWAGRGMTTPVPEFMADFARQELEATAKIGENSGTPEDFERGSSEDCAIRSARNEIAAAIRAYAEGK